MAYIQLPEAVGFIVLSARNKASFQKAIPALSEAAKSVAYMKVDMKGDARKQ